MYCSKCGRQNNDDAETCVECGNTLKKPIKKIPTPQPAPIPGLKMKKIIAIAVAVVVIIGIVFGIRNITTPGYKKVIAKWVEGVNEQDVDSLLETMPECFLDDYGRSSYRKVVSQWLRNLEFGPKDKLKYHIIGTEDLSNTESEDIKMNYEFYGAEVTDVKRMKVELGTGSDTDSIDFTMVKIDKKWYFNMFDSLWTELYEIYD